MQVQGKRAGARVGVEIIGDPIQPNGLHAVAANAPIDRPRQRRSDLQTNTRRRKCRLQALRDLREGRLVENVERKGQPLIKAGGLQDGPRPGDIEPIGRVIERAPKSRRQKGLVYLELIFQQPMSDALIIDQPARGLPQRRIGELRTVRVGRVEPRR